MAVAARQFDICRLGKSALIVVLQDDLHEGLATRIVAPLIPLAKIGPQPRGLCPTVQFNSQPYAVLIQSLSAVPLGELRETLGQARHLRDDLTRAVDLLFMGL
jgi:toxin CcdB